MHDGRVAPLGSDRRARVARHGALALAMAMVAACGSLIGFESDYSVTPPAGGGGEGGEGNAGGTAGAGDSSGGSGGQGGAPACAHELCTLGDALDAACDPCVATVCETRGFCCENLWEPDCVAAAIAECGIDCCGNDQCLGETCTDCPEDCGTCDCGHPVCTVGTALDPAQCFQPCGDEICGAMSSCCGEYGWEVACTELTLTTCPDDNCITAVCAQDPSCCTDAWTATCVGLASQAAACDTECGCAHDPCSVGDPLTATCDPCVAAACEVDSFCCATYWDSLCTSYVQSLCGAKC